MDARNICCKLVSILLYVPVVILFLYIVLVLDEMSKGFNFNSLWITWGIVILGALKNISNRKVLNI